MNLFREHIFSLPALISELTPSFAVEVERVFTKPYGLLLNRIFLTGCGDSYYAAAASKLAIETLARLPVEAQVAMQFSRYTLPALQTLEGSLLVGVSVSGGVSRTIEAVIGANARKLRTLAITSSTSTPIGAASHDVVATHVPDLPNALGVVVPGSRSFYTSLLMIMLIAIRLGEIHDVDAAITARAALQLVPELLDKLLPSADSWALRSANETLDAGEFVFCGSGPSQAIAQFCAAKMIEACGDGALGQDVEEWAHLQYFARIADTPTILVKWPGGADASRVAEVMIAMHAVGRRVNSFDFSTVFGEHGRMLPEWISPFFTAIPGLLLAAHRAELLEEKYFRDFRGGRSIEGGGGISRIRSSEIVIV